MSKFEALKEGLFNKDWYADFPDTLDYDEKVAIKRALIARFERGQDSFEALLGRLHFVTLYPET